MKDNIYPITADLELEKVLMKDYSADEIIIFFEQFLDGLGADPELQEIVEGSRLLKRPGKLVKKKRVAILMEVFQDPDLCLGFYIQQSQLCKTILNNLVWYGSFNLQSFEEFTGKRVAVKNSGQKTYWEPFLLVSGLELFKLKNAEQYYQRNDQNKTDQLVFLPEPLRRIFRLNLPKPPDHTLNPLEKKLKTTFSNCCESTALSGFTRISEFIQQGHLALKQNGDASVKGLRDLTSLAGIEEFYPTSSPKELQRLKVEMLASFFLGIDLKGIASLLAPHEWLRTVYKHWLATDDFLLIERFLEHLRITRHDYHYSYESWNIKKDLHKILKNLKTDAWVSLQNISNYCVVHQINLLEKNAASIEFHSVEDAAYHAWDRWDRVGPETILPAVYQPTLNSFFFLAAALGLVEIGYDIPVNAYYHRPKREYLSVYDGLQQVRLTKLGAYVTGKKRKYSSGTIQQQKAVFSLDKDRLLLTMKGEDPIAALTLNKTLQQTGSGRYMLTHASLFKDCLSKRDVQSKITLFREKICKKPPKIWLDFFKATLARVNPLTPEPTFKIFAIEQDPELLQLLATDPDISPLLLKVEGLRIAVKMTDIRKLTNRLKKHGYLISAKSLIG